MTKEYKALEERFDALCDMCRLNKRSMTLDRIIELAQIAARESDAKRRETAIKNLIQSTSDKIPQLIQQLDKGVGLFDDFVLQDFFKIDFVGRDDAGRNFYRRDVADINVSLHNFIVLDVKPLFENITVDCRGDKNKFGWCASLLYIALKNEQRRLQEEEELFSIAEDESEKEPQQKNTEKKGVTLNQREIKIFDVACNEDFGILAKDGNKYIYDQSVDLYKLAFVCKQINQKNTKWRRYETCFEVTGLQNSYDYYKREYTGTNTQGKTECYADWAIKFISAIK